MNLKVTEINRKHMDELMGGKMNDKQWEMFCDKIHDLSVNVYEHIMRISDEK